MPSQNDGVMIILSSPSGAGKTTLVKKLAELKNFEVSISHTTRSPRPNEILNQDYFFVKEDEFKKCLFPLSNLYKHEVRKIADDINLSVSKKKDSVGICFVGEKNLKDFLGRFMNL